MIYNNYGRTGIKVSAIGFGGMRFEIEKGLDDCAELVREAYAKGINYFDTAPMYCKDKSEEIFGIALKAMKKTRSEKPFYISTKSMKPEPVLLREQVENSLRVMGLEYIDFFHLWCVKTVEDFLERKKNGLLGELEKLRDEGLIRHICMSTHVNGPELATILDDYQFEGILLGHSVINFPYREEGLAAAAKLNRAIVCMNPLGGGAIPKNPDKFQFVKTRPDETVVEAALRFLINDPRITVVLVGLGSREQLDEAISAVEGFEPIGQEKIEKIKEQLNKSLDGICTSCRYCDLCPNGVEVPKLMEAYNQFILLGKDYNLIDYLKYSWGFDIENDFLANCSQCGQCEDACTQKLNIIERLNFLKEKVDAYLAKK